MTVTAHAPTPAVVRSLARAQWGPLAGREWGGVRDVLHGLVALLPDRSGQGLVTMPQLADAAGLSERWTRRCMGVLEDLGVVEWTRGGITRDGRPAPSFVRVVRRVLVDMIAEARPICDALAAMRRALTAKRIADARRTRGPQRFRRSPHAALSASLPTPTGEGAGGAPPEEGQSMSNYAPEDDEVCEHGGIIGRCPSCRRRTERQERYQESIRVLDQIDHAMRAAGDDTLWTD